MALAAFGAFLVTVFALFGLTVRRLPSSVDSRLPESSDHPQPQALHAKQPQPIEIVLRASDEPDTGPQITHWIGRPASLGAGFLGRTEDLLEVSSALTDFRTVVVSGGVGTGKSRLAAESAHAANVVGFWTTGQATAVSTLAALAPALDVSVEGKSDEEIASEAQRLLTDLPPEALWVIDNLSDLEVASPLLDVSGNVRLLITTRDSRRHLLPSTVAYRPIDVLEPTAAIELLCSRSETPIDHPELAQIAEKVGLLPLALEVVAARLGEPRQTPGTVLEHLENAPTPVEMEAFRQALGASIPRAEGVFAAIAGTLEDLGSGDRKALAGLGYVADAPLPDELAVALMDLAEEELTGLLTRCGRQSVLSWSDGQVRIHAMTVAALAATNPAESVLKVVERARSRLGAINSNDPIALRAELAHHEAMYFKAERHLSQDEPSLVALGNSLGAS